MGEFMQDTTKLSERLSRIWMPPDFKRFFKTYAKRKPLSIKKGNMIFYEGDEPERVYFIQEGFVKLYRSSPEGRETVIYIYGPGSILGLRALVSKDKRLKHSAETLTNVKIVTISHDEYIKILEAHPEFIIDLLHVAIGRLRHTEAKLQGFILTDSTARVASFLSDIAHRFGKKMKNGHIVIPLVLTHQKISEFVGSFRETVTIAMNRLERDKIIQDKKGEITVLNLKKLNEQALIKHSL